MYDPPVTLHYTTEEEINSTQSPPCLRTFLTLNRMKLIFTFTCVFLAWKLAPRLRRNKPTHDEKNCMLKSGRGLYFCLVTVAKENFSIFLALGYHRQDLYIMIHWKSVFYSMRIMKTHIFLACCYRKTIKQLQLPQQSPLLSFNSMFWKCVCPSYATATRQRWQFIYLFIVTFNVGVSRKQVPVLDSDDPPSTVVIVQGVV